MSAPQTIDSLKKEVEELNNQNKELIDSNKKLTEINESVVKKIKESDKIHATLTKSLEVERDTSSKLQKRLDEKTAPVDEIAGKLADTKNHLKDLENLLSDNKSKADNKIEELREKIRQLLEELTSKDSNPKKLKESPVVKRKNGVYQRQSRKNPDSEKQ